MASLECFKTPTPCPALLHHYIRSRSGGNRTEAEAKLVMGFCRLSFQKRTKTSWCAAEGKCGLATAGLYLPRHKRDHHLSVRGHGTGHVASVYDNTQIPCFTLSGVPGTPANDSSYTTEHLWPCTMLPSIVKAHLKCLLGPALHL